MRSFYTRARGRLRAVCRPDSHTIRAFQRRLLAWYAVHGRDLPWRRTREPYRILVSEIMLQQTQVERVLPKYRQFLRRFPTLRSLAAAKVGGIMANWEQPWEFVEQNLLIELNLIGEAFRHGVRRLVCLGRENTGCIWSVQTHADAGVSIDDGA